MAPSSPQQQPDPTHVAEGVARVLAARDFCGSESEALRDYCEETGAAHTPAFRNAVFAAAARAWNADRAAAGVPGFSSRRPAYAD